MIQKTILPVLLMALFLAACDDPKSKRATNNITRDTLGYTYQAVKQRAADCGAMDDTLCTSATIKYPVFVSQNKLTDTVIAHLLNLALPGMRNAPDLQTQAKNFIADYEKFYLDKRHKKMTKVPFYAKSYARVLRQDSSLVTIELGGYAFAGGAHGGALTLFLNWSTAEEKPITLDDIFITGYKKQLTITAEKIFRKQENLKDTSSLARDYFFKDAKFALNDNFVITPVGIRFLYNQYEIKPYAAGVTDLFIPYDQIKTLLKPGTVLAQYIKH